MWLLRACYVPLSVCAHRCVAYIDLHDMSESSGDGTASEQRAIEGLGAETLKLPDICGEDLHEPGEGSSVTNALAVAAEGTASLEIIGVIEEVMTAEGEDEAGRGIDTAPRKDATDWEHVPRANVSAGCQP